MTDLSNHPIFKQLESLLMEEYLIGHEYDQAFLTQDQLNQIEPYRLFQKNHFRIMLRLSPNGLTYFINSMRIHWHPLRKVSADEAEARLLSTAVLKYLSYERTYSHHIGGSLRYFICVIYYFQQQKTKSWKHLVFCPSK